MHGVLIRELNRSIYAERVSSSRQRRRDQNGRTDIAISVTVDALPATVRS